MLPLYPALFINSWVPSPVESEGAQLRFPLPCAGESKGEGRLRRAKPLQKIGVNIRRRHTQAATAFPCSISPLAPVLHPRPALTGSLSGHSILSVTDIPDARCEIRARDQNTVAGRYGSTSPAKSSGHTTVMSGTRPGSKRRRHELFTTPASCQERTPPHARLDNRPMTAIQTGPLRFGFAIHTPGALRLRRFLCFSGGRM